MTRARWSVATALLLATWTADTVRAGQEPARALPGELRLRPGALAALIDEVGGRQLSMPRARVISVINPRAFLVESASSLPTINRLERVVVLVQRGTLAVDALALVGADVRVLGTARTVLGAQVTREVPWPPELTREVVQRYGIRAAVVAASVQTPDGVELTTATAP